MSKQSFNYFERRAIWEAHGKRCAYCGQPLSFAELRIDHVLPENLATDAKLADDARKAQGLPEIFDFHGYENLTASCDPCNTRKLATVFPAGRIAIELSVTARFKPRIIALVEQFRRQDNADRVRFALVAALQEGTLNEAEVGRLAATARQGKETFRLGPLVDFFEAHSPHGISKHEIDDLLSKRVPLPPEMKDGLRLCSFGPEKVMVQTLEDYKAATARGFFAATTFEMSVAYGSFEQPLAILNAVGAARLAETSFIDEPRLGPADVAFLPATLLFVAEEMTSDEAFAGQRAKLEGQSIQKLMQREEATVRDVNSNSLRIEYDGGWTFLVELMRADFDGDGIQDILLHRGCGPIGGSYRSGSVCALTRYSDDAMFSTIAL